VLGRPFRRTAWADSRGRAGRAAVGGAAGDGGGGEQVEEGRVGADTGVRVENEGDVLRRTEGAVVLKSIGINSISIASHCA
jgi:hypothetical protein